MLKMDTLEEYNYLKKDNGVKSLLFLRLGSYFMSFVYLVIVCINWEVFFVSKSKGTWQNYEGVIFYSLFCV